jgi:hypothetical protein
MKILVPELSGRVRRFPKSLALCLLPLFTVGAFAQNLIENGNFETTDGVLADGWQSVSSNDGVFSLEKGNAPAGENSLHVHLDGIEAQFTQIKYLTLEPGKTYTFSAYVKSENLVAGVDKTPASCIRIQVINLGWSWGGQTVLKIDENTGWTRYDRTFIVPPAEQFSYQGKPNTNYKVVFYFKDLTGDVWIDGVQLEEGNEATPFSEAQVSVDPIRAGDVAEAIKKKIKYPEISDPLFEELQGPEKLGQPVFYYGYSDLLANEVFRPFAKKFAHRYVAAEEKAEISDPKEGFVVFTTGQGRGGVGSYPTLRQIFRPDAKDISPPVFNRKLSGPWTMDPRFLNAERNAAKTLAVQSLDQSADNMWGNTYGLLMGDERFESYGIKVPPKENRYAEIHEADAEVRSKFGFGKYGMPDSDSDNNPFKRIAYRRWVNAKLVENCSLISGDVRAINPKLVLMAPIICGAVPPIDIEAISGDFDLFCSQSWCGPSTDVQMFATGADTKALVDLAKCPVIAFVQHSAATDPEAVREQYSQAIRNGASGVSQLSLEWYDRELEDVKYINTRKWAAIREACKVISGMNKLNFPKADTAILYASNTYLTFDTPKMANPAHPQVYGNYIALGPEARSWFKFVSDRQIERKEINLSDFKVIYISLATYQSSTVLDALKKYIEDGGVVIATDPFAFSWDINGDSLKEKWSEITGVTHGPVRSEAGEAVVSEELAGAAGFKVTFAKPGVELLPTDSPAKPFARFSDGTMAAAIRKLGKGWIITFGTDPFDDPSRNPSVYKLVKALQVAFGAKTGEDIWRFKLPPFQNLPQKDVVTTKCLTGNYVELGANGPKPADNVNTGGRYCYDRAPDGSADVRPDGWIPFLEGKLTNRMKAYETRMKANKRGPSDPGPWIVSFKNPEAASITFDLHKSFALSNLNLFYSGSLPSFQVMGSDDGKDWKPMASLPAQPETADVLDAAVKLSGQCRFLRIAFSKRESERPMELAEVEIWGDKPPAVLAHSRSQPE